MDKKINPIASAVWKWILTVLFALIAVSFTARAFAQYPFNTSAISYNTAGSNNGFFNQDIHLTWEKEPEPGWGMYAMHFFQFQAGVGAYIGLQKTLFTGREKTAIFSVWDVGNRQTAISAHPNCVRFGHEGTGVSCIPSFEWKAGKEYKLRVWRILNSQTAQSEKWGGWVIDVETGQEFLIGIVELLNANNQAGYGLLNGVNITATEIFTGPPNPGCHNLPTFNVTWKGPFANNGSINPTSAWTSYSGNLGQTCDKVNLTSDGAFTTKHINGDKVKRTSGERSNLWQHHDINKHNKIDCAFNWAERTYPEAFAQQRLKRLSQTQFNQYYRDYRVNGVGSVIIADMISNKIIKHDTGGINTLVGSIDDVLKSSNCQ